jgi:hypothetical protein
MLGGMMASCIPTARIVARSTTADITSVIGWSVALLLVLVCGMIWAMRLKRRLKQDDGPSPSLGFTLSDLRQMHRSGQLTDDEFAKAKEKVLDAAKNAADRIPAAAGTAERDSADAIRARRLAREAHDGQDESTQ